MVKEILYTTAIDKNGNQIHVRDAKKEEIYYCPICKNEFILRKSGKTGKGSKRPHFAHHEISTNCTPEGVLHYLSKINVIKILEDYKSENKPFIINWKCIYCEKKNTGNILAQVDSIKEEYYLDEYRPDIALLNKEQKVMAVIEIVVTHKPEEKVLKYYKDNNIILIQINMISEEDLYLLKDKLEKPDIVDLCMNYRCQNMNENIINRKIKIYNTNCGFCFNRIEKYKIEINSIFGKNESSDFSENEIKSIQSNRNNIKIEIDKITKEKYPRYICRNCQKIRNKYNIRKF